jgi:hypothetical protein
VKGELVMEFENFNKCDMDVGLNGVIENGTRV